jgi:hypothetical protein
MSCDNVEGDRVKPSLRALLADSHVSAIAVAVLLVWSLDEAFRALAGPFLRVTDFLINAVAILGIPYFSWTFDERISLYLAVAHTLAAVVNLTGAWLLSRWVYGTGPLQMLSRYRMKLSGRNHA